jgi:cyclophilin family peptidyl-prolyl cis-trans isomerase
MLVQGGTIPDKQWQPPFVTLETSMGDITIELYWKHAPNTCRNFAELARRGYYNGTIFHRVIADFMVQGGDPTGKFSEESKSNFGGFTNVGSHSQALVAAVPPYTAHNSPTKSIRT